jgi:hypothetical protein
VAGAEVLGTGAEVLGGGGALGFAGGGCAGFCVGRGNGCGVCAAAAVAITKLSKETQTHRITELV